MACTGNTSYFRRERGPFLPKQHGNKFAKLAQSQGIWAEGPITNPGAIGPALSRALAVLKRGEPALIDVVCQGR